MVSLKDEDSVPRCIKVSLEGVTFYSITAEPTIIGGVLFQWVTTAACKENFPLYGIYIKMDAHE